MLFTPQKIVKESDILSSEVGEGIIAMKMDTDEVFDMQDVAKAFWTALTAMDGDVCAAAQEVLSRYDVPDNVLQADLQEFLDDLIAAGLVRAAGQ